MKLKFKQVDVFSKKPFLGNPVAVIFDADDIDTETMQRIAHWANLSETVFFQKSEKADYRLRIFTPQKELPFAGHPTIGAAHAALEAGLVKKKKFSQECGAGLIPIEISADSIMLQVSKISFDKGKIDLTTMAKACKTEQLENLVIIDCGPRWLVGYIRDNQPRANTNSPGPLLSLKPDFALLAKISEDLDITGITLYSIRDQNSIDVRSFAPAHGINEDPVCGSGNASVALHLQRYQTQMATNYVAYQGACLGRNGMVQVNRQNGISIGGQAVTTIDGEMVIKI